MRRLIVLLIAGSFMLTACGSGGEIETDPVHEIELTEQEHASTNRSINILLKSKLLIW